MTLSDARKILGLNPDENTRPHLLELQNARERIAELVNTSPNPTLADRYRKGLEEFDQALALIREHLEGPPAFVPIPPPSVTPTPRAVIVPPKAVEKMESDEPPPVPEAAKVTPTVPLVVTPPPAPAKSPEKKSRKWATAVWLILLLGALSGGGWIFWQNHQAREHSRTERLIFLERQGASLIENRRWPDAAKVYDEIERLSPSSHLIAEGRRSIEAGMVEEQQQFIGYWTGQARAELEAARWAEAEAAARQVLAKYPAEKEAAELLTRISSARVIHERDAVVEIVRKHMDARDWKAAAAAAQPLITAYPADEVIQTLQAQIQAGEKKEAEDQARALTLLQQAKALDNGSFNQQALDFLREATSLAPNNPEVIAALEKMATYGRTIHIPGDFATPEEALAGAHENDRIILGEGTWKGPLTVSTSIEIQGAGPTKTIIQCPALDGCALTLKPQAKNVRISGITLRHETFAIGEDRFSAALVQGSNAAFDNCRFMEASGHGLVVIDGGKATVIRSRFSENGWNGAAAIGKGSSLEIRESEALHNYEHGIESWSGASLTVIGSRCEMNTRNGIHADNSSAVVLLENNQVTGNDEFGIVVDSGASGKITTNTVSDNHLGGIVIRAAASALSVTKNEISRNKGAGITLEKGLSASSYQDNKQEGNQGPALQADTDFTVKQEP